MPAPLEEQLKLSPYAATSCCHGRNRAYNVRSWCSKEAPFGRGPRSRHRAFGHHARCACRAAHHRRAQPLGVVRSDPMRCRVACSSSPRTSPPTTNLLTPTLKLKRRHVGEPLRSGARRAVRGACPGGRGRDVAARFSALNRTAPLRLSDFRRSDAFGATGDRATEQLIDRGVDHAFGDVAVEDRSPVVEHVGG